MFLKYHLNNNDVFKTEYTYSLLDAYYVDMKLQYTKLKEKNNKLKLCYRINCNQIIIIINVTFFYNIRQNLQTSLITIR